ncbi:MAG: putative Ig domain-containing protein, partial [Deltaproteobacteria bacterium]|nr:putative Ig domain-containing protein [Candidatus Zymogenaceae bacterium]
MDSDFGTGGKVTNLIYGTAYALAVQPDGKIVVAGYTPTGGDFAVVRLTPGGVLDPTFSDDGKATVNFEGTDYAYGVAVQPDGKILVAGSTSNGDDFAIARFTDEGDLDTAFGENGLLTTDFGGVDVGRALTLLADGRFIVSGDSRGDFAAARYCPGPMEISVEVQNADPPVLDGYVYKDENDNGVRDLGLIAPDDVLDLVIIDNNLVQCNHYGGDMYGSYNDPYVGIDRVWYNNIQYLNNYFSDLISGPYGSRVNIVLLAPMGPDGSNPNLHWEMIDINPNDDDVFSSIDSVNAYDEYYIDLAIDSIPSLSSIESLLPSDPGNFYLAQNHPLLFRAGEETQLIDIARSILRTSSEDHETAIMFLGTSYSSETNYNAGLGDYYRNPNLPLDYLLQRAIDKDVSILLPIYHDDYLQDDLYSVYYFGNNGIGSREAITQVEWMYYPPDNPPYYIKEHLYVDDYVHTVGDINGEPGLEGWTVYIDQNQNGLCDQDEPNTVSDSTGYYNLQGIPGEDQWLRVIPQSGWIQTEPSPEPADKFPPHIVESSEPSFQGNFGMYPGQWCPKVTAIDRTYQEMTYAKNLPFEVIFDEPVFGVEESDFSVVATGSISWTNLSVEGSGTNYFVTVHGVSGTGTLGLNLEDNNSIVDQAENMLGGPAEGDGDFTGQVYTIPLPNRAPFFNSTPVVDAYVGETYHYESTASDPENDRLTFSLPLGRIEWPDDFLPELGQQFYFIDQETEIIGGWNERGIITWNPPAELAGKTVTIHEVVTDTSGNEVSRPITIMVHPSRGNHDPTIISDPSRDHWLPTDPGDSSDPWVDPLKIEINLAEGQSSQSIPVAIDLDHPDLPPDGVIGADIVFVVDESLSMSQAQQWLKDVILSIDADLQSRGIGYVEENPTGNNNYGLIGYGYSPNSLTPPVLRYIGVHDSDEDGYADQPFGTAEELKEAVDKLQAYGGWEDGYAAINSLFNEAPVSINFVLQSPLYTFDFNYDSHLYTIYPDYQDEPIAILGAVDFIGGGSVLLPTKGDWEGVDTTLSVDKGTLGFIIYDYVNNEDFKYAGLDYTDINYPQWVIGTRDSSGRHTESFSSITGSSADTLIYDISLTILNDQEVGLSARPGGSSDNYDVVASWNYGVDENVKDEALGIGAINSTDINNKNVVFANYQPVTRVSPYSFRTNALANIVLLTDENRDVNSSDDGVYPDGRDLTFPKVLKALKGDADQFIDDVTLHVITDGDLYANKSGDVGNADDFDDIQGTWTVEPLAYTGTPDLMGEAALSILTSYQSQYQQPCETMFIDTSITMADNSDHGGKGFLIFDYVDDDDFKFAGLDTVADRWIIGSCTASGFQYFVEQASGRELLPDTTYEIEIVLSRQGEYPGNEYEIVTLFIDGLEAASCNTGLIDTGILYSVGVGAMDGEATFGFYRMDYQYWPGEDWPELIDNPVYKTSFGGTKAFGVTYDHHAYLYDDESHLYIMGNRGEYEGTCHIPPEIAQGGDPSIWREYVLLAWQTGGSVWDITQLRGSISSVIQSFSAAFVDAIGDRLEEQRQVRPVVDEEGIGFSYEETETPGEFLVTFTGDGCAHNFNLEFQSGVGTAVGSIPVAVGSAYVYELYASDPDGDEPLVFSWTEGSNNNGAVLVDNVITWNPTEPGKYVFSVTVSDGHGGADVQTWPVDVYRDDTTNSPPTISPATSLKAMVRRDWTFEVEADDPDGDKLRYYLLPDPDQETNPFPTGMWIDRNTGAVSWTPSLDQEGEYTFWVLVSDGRSGKNENGVIGKVQQEFTVNVGPQTPLNRLPDFESQPPLAVIFDTDYFYRVSAKDPDGDPLTLTLVGPDGMTAAKDGSDWVVSWTAIPSLDGKEYTEKVIIRIDDRHGGVRSQAYSLLVLPENLSPEIEPIPDISIAHGQDWSYPVKADDPNGDKVFYDLDLFSTSSYMQMEIDSEGVITWKADKQRYGRFGVTVWAYDYRGGETCEQFILTVGNDAPPQFEGEILTDWTVNLPQETTFTITSPTAIANLETDVFLDDYSVARGLELINLAGGQVGDHYEYQYTLSWTPQYVGDVYIYITATNIAGVSSTAELYLVVVPPEINNPPIFYTEYLGPMVKDCLFEIQLDVEDPDGDAITSIIVVPELTTSPDFVANAAISKDGWISWKPTYPSDNYYDSYEITLRATDEHGLSQDHPYTIFVINNANPCIVAGFSKSAYLDQDYEYVMTIWDPNPEDEITIELNSDAPDGMTLLPDTDPEAPPNTWKLTWHPPAVYPGDLPYSLPVDTVHVDIRVTDNHDGYARMYFDLPVYDPDDPESPQELNGEMVIPAEREFQLRVVALGLENTPYTYILEPRLPTEAVPEGISISDSGLITWTPTIAQAGAELGDGVVYNLQVVVRILTGGDEILMPFDDLDIRVVRPEDFVPSPPEITSVAPKGAAIYDEFIYEPRANNQPGFSLQWFLDEKPEGMEIDPDTGCIYWVPEPEYLGKTVDVRLYAVDPTGAFDVQAFTLTVGSVNRPPAIDTTFPLTWSAGETLDFSVYASDPEGQPLVYALWTKYGEELPTGLSLHPLTGKLHWENPVADRYEFYVTVADRYHPDSSYIDYPWTLDVEDGVVNCEPIVIGSPNGRYVSLDPEASVQTPFTYQFTVEDLNGDTDFTWAIVAHDLANIGDRLQIDSETGWFTWTPLVEETGPHTFVISVTDNPTTGTAATTFVTFTLTAILNAPPIVTSRGEIKTVRGAQMAHQIEARDPEQGLLYYRFGLDAEVPDDMLLDGNMIWWQVPDDLGETYLTIPIVVTDQYGAETAQDLAIHVADTDSIAPTICTRVVEAEVDAQGKISHILDTLLPGEELDVSKTYVLIVDIADNSGQVNSNPEDDCTYFTALDVATLEIPSEYFALHEILQYGRNEINFTINGLNQGNIHFDIKATDFENNATTCKLTYYVHDSSQTPPAKLVQFCKSDQTEVVDLLNPITEPLNVYGIANMVDHTYELILYQADGDYYEVVKENDQYRLISQDDYVVIASGYANVTDPETVPLGTLDPTLYSSGMYRLVLAIICGCGGHHYHAVDERIIEIRNEARPGNLDLSFTDLQVDLGGIPVSLVRSYSSAEVELGRSDFGPGWSLSFLDAGIQVAHFQKATNSLHESMARGTRVMVTLPDGSLQRFTFQPELVGDDLYQPYFRPDADVTSTLEILGLNDGGADLLLLPLDEEAGNAYKGPYVTANTNRDFVPHLFGSAFLLRTQAGIEYLYDLQTGKLTAIQDDTGCRIDVATEGLTTTITASSGSEESEVRKITITRDEDGRISEIIDPKSQDLEPTDPEYHSLSYEYGNYNFETDELIPSDNLGKVTFRNDKVVQFGYVDGDFTHHLTNIYDDEKVCVLTAEYDDTGHLTQLKDASGHGANLSSLSLSDGRKLFAVTDEQGMVVEEIRDGLGRVLRRIQALEKDTDPAPLECRKYLVTEFRYTKLSGLLTDESAPFVVTGADERLEQDLDPAAYGSYWVRHLEYCDYKNGLVDLSEDALGNATIFKYDTQGRLIETTDPDLNTTYNVYDVYTGDLLETYLIGRDTGGVKLNHTRYEYQWGQLTATYQISPGGVETLISSAQYDDYGQLLSTTDANQLTRYYAYDWNGNQTHAWHNWVDPDGVLNTVVLLTITTYDANDRVTKTDEYELPLGSPEERVEDINTIDLILVTAEPFATTETQYDNRGQVGRTKDRFGLDTYNVYDARGQTIETRTQAKDESGADGWLIARTLYDAQGRVEFTTDSYFVLAADYPASADRAWSGTRTVYDLLGRVIATERHLGVTVELVEDLPDHSGQMKTKLPDGFGWDTAATKISGNQTEYDDFGRVFGSVDEYGARTEYVYDVVGQQVESRTQSQDASGTPCWLVTRTVYDPLGRPEITSDPYIVQDPDDPMPAWTGTRTVYDNQGRTVQTERLTGLVISVDPDTKQAACVAVNPVVWSTETVYNHLGQVIQTIGQHAPYQPGPVTDYEYDVYGRQTAQTGPAVTDEFSGLLVRHRSETHYDAQGRVDYTVENILVTVDAMGYSVVHDTLPEETALWHTTWYEYDAQGRQTAVVSTAIDDPDNPGITTHVRTETVYDQFGREVAKRENLKQDVSGVIDDSAVRTTWYKYDAFGRLTAVVLPAVEHPDPGIGLVHPRYEYAYDAFGNQVGISDGVYQTDPADAETIDRTGARLTRFGYDDQGRDVSRTLPLGVTTPEDPNDFIETKHYDDTSLVGATNADCSVLAGQLEYEVSFEGVVTAYRYDNTAGGRLVGKYYYVNEDFYLSDRSDDALGNLTWTDPVDGAIHMVQCVLYTYDAFGRQTQIVGPGAGDAPVQLIDDEEYGTVFSAYGWDIVADPDGFQEDVTESDSNTVYPAHWQFSGLASGTQYTLYVTWQPAANPDEAADYSLDFGTGPQSLPPVNQGISPQATPGAIQIDGVWFAPLANFSTPQSSTGVDLYLNPRTGFTVVADAAVIVALPPVTTNEYDLDGRLVTVASPEGTIHYEYDAVTGLLTRTYTGLADDDHSSTSSDGKAVTDTRYQYDALGR